MRKALAVSLALFLSACGVGGGQGPYVPPVGPDMGRTEVTLEQVPAGPDSSGKDVRLAFRLRRSTTPQMIYTNTGGKCVTFQTGTPDRNYYAMGADLSSLIPVGTLGVE